MKPLKKAFVFILVLFCFVSFARAQPTVTITSGTLTVSAGFPPATTSTSWNISGLDFFSNTNTAPDVQVIQPLIKRAGTMLEPFTLEYKPRTTARGNSRMNSLYQNIYYGSVNHNRTTIFRFNIAAHALPKFTPNRNDVFIEVPFTMEGNVGVFNNPDSTALLEARNVTARGTAHINYIRVPSNIRVRRTPNPDVWLAYVLFVFHTANGND
ncbi:MAG TPA: hypothetical protein VK400_04920 [Pyrinomonadaceae bacterium]|nr:hypothetical protein [Pyrinomonadaceae bacterium]